MITESFELPAHWVYYFVDGDSDGYEDEDLKAMEAFEDYMIERYGQCWCVDVDGDVYFKKHHDAAEYGVLACDVSRFTFDTDRVKGN